MKHSKVRDHIVETASSLFYNKGYNLTGINEIIKEAGIAKATLYNHFPSKEDICIAYLQFKNSTFTKDIRDFVLTAPSGKERIYALFNFLTLFFDQKDFNGCWCLNTYTEMPKENETVRTEIQQQKNDFIDFIENLVIENCNQNSDQANKMLARKVYLLYEGAISESKLHQNTWPIEASLSLCQKIIE
ncbi:TetR/AcrR family transcriptional regulator [Aquimarina sp. 2201CG14-23]|uniref:TetR/AcrR family transcriptional regulator n=1 Tax=Aquimarina mycalae TaxID=3040073 RepID=UPI002477ED17|nr:TetR/AcrR family transcriptional regulator [Aquimarina sp. 2201CG14-23]MDH7444856.1 TetR/AcrR family transcriptional regulator [Aquimarina sp. 2201CG14-23]